MTADIERHLSTLGVSYSDIVRDVRLGARIRMKRRLAGLRQKDLASSLHIGNSTISAVEQGDNTITLAKLAELIAALGMTVEEFFAGEVEDQAVPYRATRELRRVVVVPAKAPIINHDECIPGRYLCEECVMLMSEVTR